jgi:cell division protein ZipA
MPELRWTLLILGVVFIAALAWWERRRPHQASRESVESRPGNDSSWTSDAEPMTAPRAAREPTLTLPEMRAREPISPRELPVVEIADDSLIGLRIDGERVEEQVAAEEAAEQLEGDEDIVPTESEIVVAAEDEEELEAAVEEPEQEPELPPPVTSKVEPSVEWPPEDVRKLLAVRLVAGPADRLSGRAIRQALAGEGFVLGKFDIFHKPDGQNRAYLSAASLTKPGTFDLETMDTQRFGGLSLFAVLPGPKPPQRAFDDLLLTARTLNERLQGALQDDRGGPLTPTRVAAIRDGLEAEASS